MASIGWEWHQKATCYWKKKPSKSLFTIPTRSPTRVALVVLWVFSLLELTATQACISVKSSKMCPAFPEASISATDNTLVNLFPFLRSVTDTASFDEQLRIYILTGFVQQKYQQIFGCHGIDLTNTTNVYARFTTTVLCNAIIQNSRKVCDLSPAASRPVCAETCAQQAESESLIIANRDLCPAPSHNVESQIRADFTNCALPADSLSNTCINGAVNEPNNCGFRDNTVGLCQYCASGGINSTDTCCYNTDAQHICANIVLPVITSFVTFTTSLPTHTSVSTNSPSSEEPSHEGNSKLSPRAIVGISIGSILAVAFLGGLIFLFILCVQRRRNSKNDDTFSQQSSSGFNYLPNNSRKGQSDMAIIPVATTSEGYEILPGGRIARLSALEGHSNVAPKDEVNLSPSTSGVGGRNLGNFSSNESMISTSQGKILRPPPAGRRLGSLSSNSALAPEDPQSPISESMGGNSSPLGPASQQSEQLLFFKDYYSADEIHPGDKVSTLWAYQPRAGDEFALERGDMLKVAGIWDDGWATGVMIEDRADEWNSKRNAQRDSGVSNTSTNRPGRKNFNNEVKAFPLVCVCLPQHWRRTIEGDMSIEGDSSLPDNESDT